MTLVSIETDIFTMSNIYFYSGGQTQRPVLHWHGLNLHAHLLGESWWGGLLLQSAVLQSRGGRARAVPCPTWRWGVCSAAWPQTGHRVHCESHRSAWPDPQHSTGGHSDNRYYFQKLLFFYLRSGLSKCSISDYNNNFNV